jgi:hypothetical protein
MFYVNGERAKEWLPPLTLLLSSLSPPFSKSKKVSLKKVKNEPDPPGSSNIGKKND